MKRSFLYLLALLLLSSCGPKQIPAVGDQTYLVFDNQVVNFVPGKYPKDSVQPDANGIIHLGDGRLLLEKIHVPNFQRSVKVTATVTLKSHGDRWDKSGSLFVIPQNSSTNFLNIWTGKKSFPEPAKELEGLQGIVAGDDYQPVLELMRFMTPFGVGFYSDSTSARKPVYIDKWAKEVQWKEDVTDRISQLEGDVWIGVWVDTWTKEGYQLSATLDFDESDIPCDAKKPTHAEPVLNTVYYIGPQGYPDIFARKNINVNVDIPSGAKNVRLQYIVTGHGGDDGGDEFVQKENIISLDGKKVYDFIPWRTDCASFRRFNPSSGVWLEKRKVQYLDWKAGKYKVKEMEEPIASSDYSRSNWCPGTDVPPVTIPLDSIAAGTHQITFSIPKAQPREGDKMNFWLVSAWLDWDE